MNERERAGARMSYWIAEVLCEERERAGVPVGDVARSLRVSEATIKRLEVGRSMGRDIDGFVAGYAYLLGVEDGRDLWRMALERWYKNGQVPSFTPAEGPAAAFAEAIRAVALRQRQHESALSGTRSATRKKQAAG